MILYELKGDDDNGNQLKMYVIAKDMKGAIRLMLDTSMSDVNNIECVPLCQESEIKKEV